MDKDKLDKYIRDFRQLADANKLNEILVSASFYLIAYEFFMSNIISLPKSFFMPFEYDNERYKEKVKSLYKGDIAKATLEWFKQEGAISDEEKLEIIEMKNLRNEIAHELPRIILDSDTQIHQLKLDRIQYFYEKINKWWIINFELPIRDDYAYLQPEEMGIGVMGSMLFKALNKSLELSRKEKE